MSKLMEELMAEVERVHNLKTEVERTINHKDLEIMKTRMEKWQKDIAPFLLQMGEAVWKAGCNENRLYADTGINAVERDGYKRYIMINYSKPYLNKSVQIGGYFIGSGDIGGQQTVTMNPIFFTVYTTALIDNWSNNVKRIIEESTAKLIKSHLEYEMEQMRKDLEKVNSTYEKHFGKE